MVLSGVATVIVSRDMADENAARTREAPRASARSTGALHPGGTRQPAAGKKCGESAVCARAEAA